MSFSITTKRGDDGTTGLLYGQRVPKDHPQIEALGACDELNVALGLARAAGANVHEATNTLLLAVQKDLVALMGELACAESDAARYRDALGCNVPLGLPRAFTEPVPLPLESLLARYARAH